MQFIRFSLFFFSNGCGSWTGCFRSYKMGYVLVDNDEVVSDIDPIEEIIVSKEKLDLDAKDFCFCKAESI
jgi:hypothetical protein